VKPALYAVALVGAFLIASLAAFLLAVRPPRLTVPLRPADYRLTVEEVTITAHDGVRLAAWWSPRPGAPAVVLLHGYPAEKADLLPIAGTLAPTFAVLLVDFRYFGKSEGRVTTLGFHERGDLKRVLDFLETRGVRSIGVFGFSLGGAVALTTAAEDSRIRAITAYAPFADLKLLGRELYAWLLVLKYPLVESMLLWSRLFLGADITTPAPQAAAARLAIPVWLIHSRRDDQIPFRHAELLREALAKNPRAEFDFMTRGYHGELPSDFDARLVRFFRRALE